MKYWASHHLALFGYLCLTLGIVIGFYFLNQSRQALCTLSSDLGARVDAQQDSINQGVAFLKKYPRGAFGFTRVEIVTQINAQRRALENSKRTREALLKHLTCG